MSPARLLRNVLLGVVALVGTLATLVGGWWVYVTEPWYDGDVIRELRSGARNAPGRDEGPRLATLFPDGMAADSARSLLRASGFVCSRADADAGKELRIACSRETHDVICVGQYTVVLVFDAGRRLTGRSGNSYVTCL